MAASDNPALKDQEIDPTLFCTAYKKKRFYMISRREPIDTEEFFFLFSPSHNLNHQLIKSNNSNNN